MLAAAMLLSSATVQSADSGFAAWHRADEWLAAGDATLDPADNRRLAGRPGTGVIINGRTGKARSLVTRRRDFRDVELHIEFMVAKGSNSGVIFHGLYEIQILDSHHVKNPTAGHCGGIYPRAETKPKYHYIDKGSPPRVNAARPPGEWQTYDIIFRSPRFDAAGRKTAHAKFVKVTHNGRVIQEDQEVKWATGTNWDRRQHPQGPIIIQGDYGPIALRNLRVRDWKPGDEARPNAPPEGFTALFNGRDFTGWRRSPRARKMWSVEGGVLKAHGLLEQWGADLVTERKFRDFVLMADFRMPTASDSGIHFRGLAPAMLGKFGDTEQFNIKADAAMGRLESFNFMTADMKRGLGLKAKDLPRIKRTAPKVEVWHTVKLTLVGKNLTAELDGEIIIDHFEYPKGILSMEPSAISLQKHRYWDWPGGGKNPCPIEFRNIFIKEIEPRGLNVPPEGFTALFNGRDLTGWHTPPLVRKYWSVEDGVLKSPGLIRTWGACLATKKHYRDFVLMLDFRMPTISDSGINFRRLIPEIKGFGDMEQFNLRSKGGMGHLESYYFLPKETAIKHRLKEEEKPHVRHIDPKVGVWHTVKLTIKGRTFSSEYDGEVLLDGFKYHDWMLNMEPAPIRLQKHIVTYGNTDMGRNLGDVNPCPIEYRNIFVKEIKPGAVDLPPELPLGEKPPRGD